MSFSIGDKVTVSPYAIGKPEATNSFCWANVAAIHEDGDLLCVWTQRTGQSWVSPSYVLRGHVPDPTFQLNLVEKERQAILADPTARRRDALLANVFGRPQVPPPVPLPKRGKYGTIPGTMILWGSPLYFHHVDDDIKDLHCLSALSNDTLLDAVFVPYDIADGGFLVWSDLDFPPRPQWHLHRSLDGLSLYLGPEPPWYEMALLDLDRCQQR